MKKTLLQTIILALLLSSCASSIYVFKFSPTPGIDFKKGRWLLNDIESPYIIKPELTKIVVKAFSKYLKGNLYILNKTNGLILPPKIPLNPSKLILKDIKNGTGFDYFINIKTKIIKNDVGSISFGASDDNNQVFNDDSKGMIITKGPNSLIIGALRRIIKKIEKNHRKKLIQISFVKMF